MGCGGGCGKGQKRKLYSSKRRLLMASAKGLDPSAPTVTLQYVGRNWGTQSYYFGGKRYRFGKARPVGEVAAEDADAMLALRDGGKPVFTMIGAPKVLQVSTRRKKELSKQFEVEELAPIEKTRMLIDPRELSTAQVKEAVEMSAGLDRYEIEHMIELENKGKKRKSVLNLLNGLLRK